MGRRRVKAPPAAAWANSARKKRRARGLDLRGLPGATRSSYNRRHLRERDMTRRFEYYHAGLDPARTLVVDGIAEAALNLSHWPGNRTPRRYRADTTTEMALRLAEDP